MQSNPIESMNVKAVREGAILGHLIGATIAMYHNDNSRTGVNPFDTALTIKNVNPLTFGKKFDLPVDGQVYAQPLVVSNISIEGVLHSVLVVATEHYSVYAFDAPGTIPSIANGVVFAIEHASGSTVLHAYDATDLHELYNSKQNSTMESGTKFAVPTIFSKMVYIGTDHHVSVFGLK